ncbi:MAG: chemotaxis protein CheW, partial [Luminiphilus sp.]
MNERLEDQALESAEDAQQFLSFKLGGEEYGVDILKVQEIKGWEGATPIPNMPSYILGVINLRGTVVPIIN